MQSPARLGGMEGGLSKLLLPEKQPTRPSRLCWRFSLAGRCVPAGLCVLVEGAGARAGCGAACGPRGTLARMNALHTP